MIEAWAARCTLAAFPLASLAACSAPPLPGSTELEQISIRTVQTEVLSALPSGSREPGDRVLKGHQLDRYFVDGGWVEVLWVEPRDGVRVGGDLRRSVNPVIFRDEILDGWGWDHFDLRSQEWGIQVPEMPVPPPETEAEDGAGIEPGGISAYRARRTIPRTTPDTSAAQKAASSRIALSTSSG